MRVPVAVEWLSAVLTGQMVERPLVYLALMAVPPCHAALVRAESFGVSLRSFNGSAALWADKHIIRLRMPVDVRFNGVYRHTERRRNGCAAVAFRPHGVDGFFGLLSHGGFLSANRPISWFPFFE